MWFVLNRHCTLQEWCMVCSHFWGALYLILCVFESMSSCSLLVLLMCKLPSAVNAEMKEGTSTISPHWQSCCWSTNSNIRGPSSGPSLHHHEGYLWRIEATNPNSILTLVCSHIKIRQIGGKCTGKVVSLLKDGNTKVSGWVIFFCFILNFCRSLIRIVASPSGRIISKHWSSSKN